MILYYRLFKKVFKKFLCQICNGDYCPQVHHVDLNVFNNNVDNLIIVCRNCHSMLHNKPTKEMVSKVSCIVEDNLYKIERLGILQISS